LLCTGNILDSKKLDPMNHSQWKLLLLDNIENNGGDKVWLLKKVGIEKKTLLSLTHFGGIFS
jgi:hypothetical protein